MRIAYIITAHNNPKHLKRLIDAISEDYVDIYLHINKTVDINQFNLPTKNNLHLVTERVNINWGGFSLVQALLNSLKQAEKTGKYDYYIFISGSDYPVRSNSYIYKFLLENNGTEFINLVKMPGNGKTLDRIYNYHIGGGYTDGAGKKLLIRVINGFIKKLNLKRKLPKSLVAKEFYGGSTWWALTGNCIKYILEALEKDTSITRFFVNTFAADESLFQTLIANSKYKKAVRNSVIYTKWSNNKQSHPELLTSQDIDLLTSHEVVTSYGKSVILLARKFDDRSEDLTNEVDSKLRK